MRSVIIVKISTYVDQVFRGFLRRSPVRKIHNLEDFFQMRSNCVHVRTCPAIMFLFEGVSKLLMFLLMSYTCIYVYNVENSHSGHPYIVPRNTTTDDPYFLYSVAMQKEFSTYEYLLVIMLIGSLLHEVGEFQESGYSAREYYGVSA